MCSVALGVLWVLNEAGTVSNVCSEQFWTSQILERVILKNCQFFLDFVLQDFSLLAFPLFSFESLVIIFH